MKWKSLNDSVKLRDNPCNSVVKKNQIMKISESAVKNYQFTIVIFLLLIALGIYSYLKIPQAEDPEFPISIFPIIAIYPGASPADIEQLVVDKVEESLNELEDIETIKSEIKDGVAIIVIEFSSDTDPDKKYDEILRQINSIRSSLPMTFTVLRL